MGGTVFALECLVIIYCRLWARRQGGVLGDLSALLGVMCFVRGWLTFLRSLLEDDDSD